jgi:site-specific DNA-cytosine methylase
LHIGISTGGFRHQQGASTGPSPLLALLLHRNCSCGAGKDIKKRHAKECLYGKPIVSRKGEFFIRFVHKLMEAGDLVAWRVLNSADYGDAPTRKRLFIIARKGMMISEFSARHIYPTHNPYTTKRPFRRAMRHMITKWRSTVPIF